MRPKNNQWYRVFHFSKKERNALSFFVPVLLVLWFIPSWWNRKPAEITIINAMVEEPQNVTTVADVDDVVMQPEPSVQHFASIPIKMQRFNPNTADRAMLLQLGLPERTVNTIVNYRHKGGVFRQASDLKKIYGLKEEDYSRIARYVDIPAVARSAKAFEKETQNTHREGALQAEMVSVDIASADATELKTLPGIGDILSQRIVQFRDKLGGFHNVEQLAEVYGLQDSVYQKVKPLLTLSPNNIQLININNCTVEDLRNHPYIKYNVANAVINYRTQHGVFNNLEDLLKIHLISDSLYKKLSPYLTY